jgi:hypothetical protein
MTTPIWPAAPSPQFGGGVQRKVEALSSDPEASNKEIEMDVWLSETEWKP